MQIGCHLPTQGPVATREALLTFCRKAEEQQIASLWVSDHVVFPKVNTSNYPGGRFPPHAPETPYLSQSPSWPPQRCVRNALASVPRSSSWGTGILWSWPRCSPLLMPCPMAGSFVAVGVGWWAEEFAALGIPFHTRGRQGDEMLRVSGIAIPF